MDAREKTVVVGLGPMGAAIGARLADQAWDVTGLDLDQERTDRWRRTAARPAATDIAEIEWASVGRIVIALRTCPQVESVLASDEVGRALAHGAGAFLVTTLTPSDARRLLDRQPSGRLFELPVSGGVPRARRGDLTGLLAGPPLDCTDERLLRDVFAHTFRFDEPGQPSMVKLINNSLAAHHLLGTTVAVRAAQELGLDGRLAHRIIAASSGSSLTGDLLPDLTQNDADLLLKDVRLLEQELGRAPFEDITFGSLPERFAAARALLHPHD